LGKYYLTTSLDLDYAREQFTFEIAALSSYVLGQAQHGSISMSVPPTEAQAVDAHTIGGTDRGSSSIEIDVLQVCLVSVTVCFFANHLYIVPKCFSMCSGLF
jgi:hypothetical protein